MLGRLLRPSKVLDSRARQPLHLGLALPLAPRATPARWHAIIRGRAGGRRCLLIILATSAAKLVVVVLRAPCRLALAPRGRPEASPLVLGRSEPVRGVA
eukprot:scaffold51333_cov27-Tisochrysis_lutea.AAC.2